MLRGVEEMLGSRRGSWVNVKDLLVGKPRPTTFRDEIFVATRLCAKPLCGWISAALVDPFGRVFGAELNPAAPPDCSHAGCRRPPCCGMADVLFPAVDACTSGSLENDAFGFKAGPRA